MDSIDHYINRVQNLPPAPIVAIQLLNLFSDPDRDIDRIVELISHDPSLTAATLKRCNSGALGGVKPASDMFEAVSRLGLYEVYCIVIGLTTSQTMMQVRQKYTWDSTRLWRHAVTTAVIASILAKRVAVVEATAFTAGLLHDIGKLIFVSVEGVAYAEMARNAGLFGPKFVAAEKSSVGFSHAVLGARLLTRWGLPENVCLAIKMHHQPPTAATQHQRLAATVNLANSLAHRMIDGRTEMPTAASSNSEAMDLVGLTAEDNLSFVRQIEQRLERFHGLLQIHGRVMDQSVL